MMAVDDGRARLRITHGLLAHVTAKVSDLRPLRIASVSTCQETVPQVGTSGGSKRKATPAASHVKDGVDDLASLILAV
ncbi:MAG: hypothetical protein J2P36_00270 [Ktedonobacteraceae bacterium]|nr:hypothetical protein [Ktedonobacteraceae bacterium]